MKNKRSWQLFVWVGLGFGLMLSAWTTFFVVAAHHRVQDVPLVTARDETPKTSLRR